MVACAAPPVVALIASARLVKVLLAGVIVYCCPFAVSVNDVAELMLAEVGSATVAVLAALARDPGSTTSIEYVPGKAPGLTDALATVGSEYVVAKLPLPTEELTEYSVA